MLVPTVRIKDSGQQGVSPARARPDAAPLTVVDVTEGAAAEFARQSVLSTDSELHLSLLCFLFESENLV